jgi:hypothetical protein
MLAAEAHITEIIHKDLRKPWCIASILKQTLSVAKLVIVPKDDRKDDCYLDN